MSKSIFKIENNTLYRYASDIQPYNEQYTFYISKLEGANVIRWLKNSTYSTTESANRAYKANFETIADAIESIGYKRPIINENGLGEYKGTFEELQYVPLDGNLPAQTLEELEERPIVIEQTDKTDET